MITIKYFCGLTLLTCTISICHKIYLSYLFENEYHFSHLSEVEREISFQSEAGFYYSFYKVLVTSSSFSLGLGKLIADNGTEYPDTINTLERFNLFPEVLTASLYKMSMWLLSTLNLPTKVCYKVNRGQGREAVTSCEGIGEPVYVYLESIFTLNGLMLGFMFLHATYMSNNIFGGLVTVFTFFYNHGESTRVYLTPPLRESFGYPFWVLHCYITSFVLSSKKDTKKFLIFIGLSTFFFLLPWQFSQFVLFTQSSVIFTLYAANVITTGRLQLIMFGYLIGQMFATIFQFNNVMLFTSFFLSSCLVSLLLAQVKETFFDTKLKLSHFILLPYICGVFVVKILLSLITESQDDSHIFEIMISKFTSYKSFHTMLYTCAPEFDFIDMQTFIEISKTCLLPIVVIVIIRLLHLAYIDCFKNGDEIRKKNDVANHLYMIIQLLIFFVMAGVVMRLKLFLVPHMCLLASMIASKQFLYGSWNKLCILVAIISVISYKGIQNMHLQTSIVGEFDDRGTEELMTWISENTEQNAVFAGSMPTMSAIKLSTWRYIVNHPHYENYKLRERTKSVYTIYSRKSIEEVWENVSELGVDYIVLEKAWCFGRSKLNCSLAEIWDHEDIINRDNPKVCDVLSEHSNPLFRSTYKNSRYNVFKVFKKKK